MAVRFFNHAANEARVIAMILPKTFRKASIVKKLNPAFHLIHDEDVPAKAFEFEGRSYTVPAAFQIWERRLELRRPEPMQNHHPDFTFARQNRAHFAIRRNGVRAGLVHRDLTVNEHSHYFIKVNNEDSVDEIEAVMNQLNFASVKHNASGSPSLVQTEIVSLYQSWIDMHPGRRVERNHR